MSVDFFICVCLCQMLQGAGMIVPENWHVLVFGISQNLQGRTEQNFNTGVSESRTEPNSSKV